MPFQGDVVVTPDGGSSKNWRLVQPFDYQGKTEHFTVPVGFVTDFASVPRVFVWLLPRYGRWTQAAILHDYLWRQHGLNKFDSDGIFNRAMRELEVPFLRRWLMWAAVRWASGPRTWFVRGPLPFGQMVAISVPALVLVAVPSLLVFVALVVGMLCEYVVFGVLKATGRDTVVSPDPSDVLTS